VKDDELLALLQQAANALDEEAIDLVDIDTDSSGRHKPVVGARDRAFFAALNDQAAGLRDLIAMLQARREETR
jgi:hypothetical protein